MKEQNGLSRRDILKGSLMTAGAGVLAFGGLNAAEAAPQKAKNPEYDLVIIGAGCAGLVCAIQAVESGLKPVVLEKMPRPAGNTVFAGGHLLALESRFQKAQGIQDTAQSFYDDMMSMSLGKGDPVLTKFFVDKSTEAIHWLSDVVGVKWKHIEIEAYPARGRSHVVDGPSKPGGAQLSKDLVQAAQKRNIPIMFETKVIEITSDDVLRVTGVKAVSQKEGALTITAKYGVVLATGGFHANNEMVTSLIGGWAANMPIRGSRIIMGENFVLPRHLFPKFVNVDQFHAGPIHGPTGANPSIMVNYGILVTHNGERYVDEVNTYVSVAKHTARTVKSNWAFIIMDSAARQGSAMVEERFDRYKRNKAPIYTANTIEELAEQAGINKANLVAVVKEYNEALKNKTLDQMTPPNTLEAPKPILTAPFFAVPFQGGMTATFGGPQVNVKAEVLNTENKPIQGLYAIGNSIGGLFYDDYIVGAQLTSATIFGRVAALEIAKKKNKA